MEGSIRIKTEDLATLVWEHARAAVLERGRHLLASTPMTGEYTANALWGWELRRMLVEGDDLFLLDVREAGSRKEGRLSGSLQISFKDWARPETLDLLPIDRKIAVVCETGDIASQIVAGLRLLGFDAIAIKSGICGLAQVEASVDLSRAIKSAAYDVERTPPERLWSEDMPLMHFSPPGVREFLQIVKRAGEVMSNVPDSGDFVSNIISPEDLNRLLADPETAGEIFLLDLRREEDYEGVGHIPGAAHVDFQSALSSEALPLLPVDRKIVTVCYTGNLAAQLTTVLRLLGYDAGVLANGMTCWSRTPTAYHYLKDIEGADLDLAKS